MPLLINLPTYVTYLLVLTVAVAACDSAPAHDHLNVANMWKGVVERTNQVGYFDRANTAPYIEIPSIDLLLRTNRSKTVRPGWSLRLMLSYIVGGR